MHRLPVPCTNNIFSDSSNVMTITYSDLKHAQSKTDEHTWEWSIGIGKQKASFCGYCQVI